MGLLKKLLLAGEVGVWKNAGRSSNFCLCVTCFHWRLYKDQIPYNTPPYLGEERPWIQRISPFNPCDYEAVNLSGRGCILLGDNAFSGYHMYCQNLPQDNSMRECFLGLCARGIALRLCSIPHFSSVCLCWSAISSLCAATKLLWIPRWKLFDLLVPP